jgi:hypothetical protein
MTEFKLCEEMGLKVKNYSTGYNTDDIFILASDVEKMLQGGERKKEVVYYIRETGSSGFGHPVYAKDESLTLSIPQKPKPVSKAEIVAILETFNVSEKTEAAKLIERIEKAGIE